MLAINGVYDKGKIELLKEVPIKGKRRVVVTFLDEPLVETDLGLEIDPIRALKGCARGLNLTEKLLESRKEDLNLEKSGAFLRQCLNSEINYTTSRDLIEVKDY